MHCCFARRRRVLSGGYDRTLRLWGVDSGKEIQRFEQVHAELVTCSFLPGQGRAISGGYNHTIKVWNLRK